MAEIDTIKEFAQLGFTRLDGALKDITEEQLDWKSCTEANTDPRSYQATKTQKQQDTMQSPIKASKTS